MDLDIAIQKHAQWKFKFNSHLQSVKSGQTVEALDVATIAKDNCCDFGKWLHGEAKARFAEKPAWSKCVTAHAEFHREAGKIAQALNAKKAEEAERMMAPHTAFAEASRAVGVAIIEMKNHSKA
jgi:methyl-accepting chemotaxis protein